MLDRRQEGFQVAGGGELDLFGAPDPTASVPEGHARSALQIGTEGMGPEAQ